MNDATATEDRKDHLPEPGSPPDWLRVDAGALAWVLPEIAASFEGTLEALRRFAAQEDDAADALRMARMQLHQAHGALQMLDLPGMESVTDNAEKLCALFEQSPGRCDHAALETLAAAFRDVTGHLETVLESRVHQPLRLYPACRELLRLLDAERIHPADLFFPPLTIRPQDVGSAGDMGESDVQGTGHGIDVAAERNRYERSLLLFLRDGDSDAGQNAAAAMRAAVGSIESYVSSRTATSLAAGAQQRALWWVAGAFFDALAARSLPVDINVKRLCARINQQMRRMIEGSDAVAERLLRDTLFFVALAPATTERQRAVHRAYRLAGAVPDDFATQRYSHLDLRTLQQARMHLAQAKAALDAFAGSTGGPAGQPGHDYLHAMTELRKAVEQLGHPGLIRLVDALSGAWPGVFGNAALGGQSALEAAGALLFLETALETPRALDASFEMRAAQVARRVSAGTAGQPLPSETEPWMDEFLQRAQERISMANFATEMRGNLQTAEKILDTFFANPAQRGNLPAAVGLLAQTSSALALLGHDQAAQAIASARTSIQSFVDAAGPAEMPGANEEFERIAQTLGAVDFFIEHIRHGGNSGRNFRFDPATGAFTAELIVSGATDREAAQDAGAAIARDLPAEDDRLAAAPPVPPLPPATEASFEQTFARLGEEAMRLAALLQSDVRDRQARARLADILERMRQDAVLLDDPVVRDQAAGALKLLNQSDDLVPDELAVHVATLAGLAGAAGATGAEYLSAGTVTTADAARTSSPPHPSREQPQLSEPPSQVPAPGGTDTADADAELMGIFLAEAEEVLEQARDAVSVLRDQPGERDALATVRRAFHTLKGSSRMVGLREFGETAWAIEQTLNEWLAGSRPATEDLLALSETAGGFLHAWVSELATQGRSVRDSAALAAAAAAVRAGEPFAWQAVMPAGNERPTMEAAGETGGGAANVAAGEAADVAAESAPPDTPPAIQTSDAPSRVIPFAAPAAPRPEEFRQIGSLTLALPLYNIYLAEADELLRTLAHDFGEWRHELHRGPSEAAARAAHSLSGTSATIGLTPVHDLAHGIDNALQSLLSHPVPVGPEEIDILEDAVEGLRAMLHRFAAEVPPEADAARLGNLETLRARLKARHDALDAALVASPATSPPAPESVPESASGLASGLALHPASPDTSPTGPQEAFGSEAEATSTDIPTHAAVSDGIPDIIDAAAAGVFVHSVPLSPAPPSTVPPRAEIDHVRDDIDPDLLEIFIEEANESMARISAALRHWQEHPDDDDAARGLMRLLHTIKGSARMAGAMRLGELTHNMETRIESAMLLRERSPGFFDELLAEHDRGLELFERLARPAAAQDMENIAAAQHGSARGMSWAQTTQPGVSGTAEGDGITGDAADHDTLGGTSSGGSTPEVAPAPATGKTPVPMLRVRADMLDRLVNQAGEVSIARSRLENGLGQIKTSLSDLTENLERLRGQLREIEIQAESQMQSHLSHVRDKDQFDPLEFDRFTRLQELTRILAESVDDVATVRQNLLKSLSDAQRDLGTQQRMTRDMQQELMRVRMVPFSSISERLYRVARRAAKELDKRVSLDIRGGHVELDRSVLERMVGPFEHLLRNAVVHGIETREARRAAGKGETGELLIEVRQEGNEILITFTDDGGGLDLVRIRQRARAAGLIGTDGEIPDNLAAELIFRPGFSTADTVTELAGRGVGMDVVRSEAGALGGRVMVEPMPVGTRFLITLPLTLAVTQVVLVNAAGRLYALPAALVEQMQQLRPQGLAQAYANGYIKWQDQSVDLCFLANLLGEVESAPIAQRLSPVLILRSAGVRVAVHVDEVMGNLEVVVKNIGPQLARLPGIAGATILPSGEIVLILNPVQLVRRTRQGEPGHLQQRFPHNPIDLGNGEHAEETGMADTAAAPSTLPLVMVVDDSITVRRVTQRLLAREGYQVMLAKDGVDALQQLQDYMPDVMLVDIEMPRMDGFDLTRNVRSDPRFKDIPIIMITSRTADKHRNHALELGVNVYLGKPYREDELLKHVAAFTAGRR